MTPFDELTAAELVALDDASVEYYIDRECAEAGVELLPPQRPTPPEKAAPDKDVTVYTLGAFDFTDLQDATDVAAFIRGRKSLISVGYIRGHYSEKVVEAVKDHDFSITTTQVFSASVAATAQAAILAHVTASTRYEADKTAYEKIAKARERWAERITGKIAEAHEAVSRRRRMTELHERYLTLAHGDADIARRFLVAACYDAAEVLPELFAGVDLPTPTPPPAEPPATDDDDIPL